MFKLKGGDAEVDSMMLSDIIGDRFALQFGEWKGANTELDKLFKLNVI